MIDCFQKKKKFSSYFIQTASNELNITNTRWSSVVSFRYQTEEGKTKTKTSKPCE